jgi:hypothetical protein
VDHFAFPVADRAELDAAAAHLDELSIAHEDIKDIASAASSGHVSHRTGSPKANPPLVSTRNVLRPIRQVLVASRSAKAFRLPRGVGGVLSRCRRRTSRPTLPSSADRCTSYNGESERGLFAMCLKSECVRGTHHDPSISKCQTALRC